MPMRASTSMPATRWSKPSSRRSAPPRRAGADAEIGGFGGLFDLKAAGFIDPVLVAANDGVGTKLKIAIDTGSHYTIGIDLVAMCVNDLVVQGAEPLFFLDYFATGKLDVDDRHARSSRASPKAAAIAGCALIGGETAEMPGMYHGRRLRPRRLCRRRRRARHAAAARATSRPATCSSASPRRAFTPTAFRWCARSSRSRASTGTLPAPFDAGMTLGGALLTPTRIYVKPLPARDPRGRRGIKALAHITGGGFIDNIPRVLPEASRRAHRPRRDRRCRRCSAGWRAVGGIAEREMLRTFNCGVGMIAHRASATRSSR